MSNPNAAVQCSLERFRTVRRWSELLQTGFRPGQGASPFNLVCFNRDEATGADSGMGPRRCEGPARGPDGGPLAERWERRWHL